MDAGTRSLALCIVTLLGLSVAIVPVAGAPSASGIPTPPFNDTTDREYVEAGCLGIDITVQNTSTDSIGLESENLTADDATVRATDELPAGPNGTFRIESDFIDPENVCFNERVGNETGSRLDLINVTTHNSTIIGPYLRTEYRVGTADAIRIESRLTVDELVDELL